MNVFLFYHLASICIFLAMGIRYNWKSWFFWYGSMISVMLLAYSAAAAKDLWGMILSLVLLVLCLVRCIMVSHKREYLYTAESATVRWSYFQAESVEAAEKKFEERNGHKPHTIYEVGKARPIKS